MVFWFNCNCCIRRQNIELFFSRRQIFTNIYSFVLVRGSSYRRTIDSKKKRTIYKHNGNEKSTFHDICEESDTKFTAPFNMQILKFKAQPTNAVFATVNQMFSASSQFPTTAEHSFAVWTVLNDLISALDSSRKQVGAAENCNHIL